MPPKGGGLLEMRLLCVLLNIVEGRARNGGKSIKGSGRRPTLNYREKGGHDLREKLVGPAGGLSKSAFATYRPLHVYTPSVP